MPLIPEIVTLCHGALAHGPRLFIWDAFHQITVPSFPSWLPPYAVVCRVRCEDIALGRHKLRVNVVDPDGRILAQMEAVFDQVPEPEPLGFIFYPIGMEIRCAGGHAVDLILDDLPPVRTPFEVRQVQSPPPVPPPGG